MYNKFKIDSKKCLDEITAEGYASRNVFETYTGECFEGVDAKMLANVQNPAMEHARKTIQAAAAKADK